jgi:hypothetical protein
MDKQIRTNIEKTNTLLKRKYVDDKEKKQQIEVLFLN